jgi:hypothetical protein
LILSVHIQGKPHGKVHFLNTSANDIRSFSVSEDWFFGHTARKLGSRVTMCSSVFVETETPTSIFFSSGSRGGFGEMTIFSQRFYRWNFFFVNGMFYNMAYIFGSWKLGFWEIGAKIFVFQEVYETLLYLLAPFVLPISLVVRPIFCVYMLIATVGMYYINVTVSLQYNRRNTPSLQVADFRIDFQRGSLTQTQRASRMGRRVHLLHAVQNHPDPRQRLQLLLLSLQVRQVLRQKASQDHRRRKGGRSCPATRGVYTEER